MSVFVNIFDGSRAILHLEDVGSNVKHLCTAVQNKKHFPLGDLQVYHNGRLAQQYDRLLPDGTYHFVPGLKGGKGGFGAMLRMIGAQIEKTTNREACRDLSGRRMRDVNNEKNLQAWIEKKKQQEEERARKRREKLERMRSQPKHYFVDPKYNEQKEAVAESLDEAVSTGISVAGPSGSRPSATGGTKRKADSQSDHDSDDDDVDDDDDDIDEAAMKRHCMWLGIEGEGEDEDDQQEASKVEEEDQEKPAVEREIPTPSSTSASLSSSSSSPVPQEPDLRAEKEMDDVTPSDQASSSTNPLLSSLPPPSNQTQTGPVNLEDYSSPEDLEAVGLDRLKGALMDKGMKCGGTLQERAQRLYSVKGLEPSQIDPSLLAKPSKGKKGKKK